MLARSCLLANTHKCRIEENVSNIEPGPLTQQGLRLIEDESDDWSLHDRGIEILREAVRLGEGAAPKALATAMVERGWSEEAADLLVPFVENGRFDLSGFLADILSELGRVEQAEIFYRMAIDHNDIDALADYGVFLVDQGRVSEAIPVYERAIEAGDTLAPGNLVNLYADELKDLPQALRLGRQYLDPRHPGTYPALANVEEKLGNLDEAQLLYEKAVELEAPRAHLRLAAFLEERRGNLVAAERELWEAKENDEPGWGYQLGKFLLERERYDEAGNVLSHAAHWGDQDAKALLDEEFEDVDEDET